MTPPSSAAGSVPKTVTVGENGIGEFNLVYLKNSAVWIRDRIRASTVVSGTETTSSMTFQLLYERAEGLAGDLPKSSYPIWLTPGTTYNVNTCNLTFPQFGDPGFDSFSSTGSLTAGSSSIVGNTYTYDPAGGTTPAQVGDWVWDFITASGLMDSSSATPISIWANFPVRIIIK